MRRSHVPRCQLEASLGPEDCVACQCIVLPMGWTCPISSTWTTHTGARRATRSLSRQSGRALRKAADRRVGIAPRGALARRQLANGSCSTLKRTLKNIKRVLQQKRKRKAPEGGTPRGVLPIGGRATRDGRPRVPVAPNDCKLETSALADTGSDVQQMRDFGKC